MKYHNVYDTNNDMPNAEAVKTELRKRGYLPNFAIEDNVVKMRKIGDYNVSGGGTIFFVPDDFPETIGKQKANSDQTS